MRTNNTNESRNECPCRTVFDHLTGRWALLVLVSLNEGPLRFHALRDCVEGVSEKMLTHTLRNLVRDGLAMRHAEPTIPPRVSYALTPLGQEMAAPLREVLECIGRRIGDITASQRAYDAKE